MSDPPGEAAPADPICDARWLARERIIGRFEAGLAAGSAPSIEDFAAEGGAEPGLLVELVHAEIGWKSTRGEPASIAEYLARFPILGAGDDVLRDLLDAADGARPRPARPRPQTEPAGREPSTGADLPGRGRRLGRYELIERVGQGAFGVVYRALDTELGRVVAVKIPRPDAPGPAGGDHFLREARSAAGIRHPGIVTVFDASRIDGRHVLVSEFVVGPTLEESIGRSRGGPRWAAEILAQVAEAIGEAHRAGVVHRDLKPANILLEGGHRPRVTDFGLARDGSDAATTADGHLLGTIPYMAPEQLLRRGKAAGSRVDVYALGVILYQLLVGELPFRGHEARLIAQALDAEPKRPRLLDPRVPRDLETIALTCLEKDPARRYADGDALAADLRRHLAGEPILARRSSPWSRLSRRIARRPLNFALASLSLVASIALMATWADRARRDRAHADDVAAADRAHAEAIGAEAEKTRASLYAAEVNLAFDALAKGQDEKARQILDAQVPTPPAPDPRGFEWHYLRGRCARDLVLRGHGGSIRAAAFSPDGSILATAGIDHTIRLWDTPTWAGRAVLRGHDRLVSTLAFSPDGAVLYSGGYDGAILRWDARTGRPLGVVLRSRPAVLSMVPSPDGRSLAYYLAGAVATRLVDSTTGAVRVSFAATAAATWGLAFSPDGRTLATADTGGLVALWDAATGARRADLRGPEGELSGVAFDRSGRYIAASSNNLRVTVWDVATRRPVAPEPPVTTPASTCAFVPDGRTLAVGMRGDILLWDVPGARVRGRLGGHRGPVRALAISPDGRTLVSGSDDGIARAWDVGSASAVRDRTLGASTTGLDGANPVGEVVHGLDFSADGRSFAAVGDRGVVRIWDVPTGTARRLDGVAGPEGRAVRFLSDGRSLAIGVAKGVIRVVDAESGSVRLNLTPGPDEARACWSIAATPDGRSLYAGYGNQGEPGPILGWDLESGARIATLAGHADYIRGVAVSPDGRTLASGSGDESVKLWRIADGAELATMRSDSGQVFCVAFSPDGRLVASGSEDNRVRLWDVGPRRLHATLDGHISPVHAVAFSPDGRRIASASRDGLILLWDVETGRLLGPLVGHEKRVNGLAFSPDGRILASGGYDKAVRFWRGAAADGPATPVVKASSSTR